MCKPSVSSSEEESQAEGASALMKAEEEARLKAEEEDALQVTSYSA